MSKLIKYKIRRTDTGLGYFALEPIPKGKRIAEYTGPYISNEEVERRSGKYFFGVNSKWSIDGSPRSNIARYINHSCRPNSEALISGRRVWIWSKRNIKPGEEITYDYGDEYFEDIIKPMGCKCEKCAAKAGRGKKEPGAVRNVEGLAAGICAALRSPVRIDASSGMGGFLARRSALVTLISKVEVLPKVGMVG